MSIPADLARLTALSRESRASITSTGAWEHVVLYDGGVVSEVEQFAHLVEQPSMRPAFAVERVARRELLEALAVSRRDDIADAGGGVWMLLEQPGEALAVHLDHFNVGERAHTCIARFSGHQRHLTGYIAARVVGNVANLAIGGMAEDFGLPAAYDEHRLALFARAHQHLARAKLPHRDGRHQQFQLIVAEAAQPIDLAQVGHQLALELRVGLLVLVAAGVAD